MKIKYINNNPKYGIDYDWKLIQKEFNKLQIPDDVFNPYKFHKIEGGKYIFDLSERDTGKTTNWLLLAMCINKLYGSEIVYIRETLDMILPKNDSELFKTIRMFDYVSKITNGQYNDIRYRSRRYYYFNRETGEEANDPFMLKWSLDENVVKKSSVQLPDSDIIIFDECISPKNYMGEFVVFMDTIKSIIRRRFSPLIVLLANTINTQSMWFKEFEIYDAVQGIEPSQTITVTSSLGTVVDVAHIGQSFETMSADRIEHNKRFFGFKNPQLNSIRGGSWAFDVYQHPYREPDSESIINNRYIEHNGNILNLEVMHNNKHGYYVVVHKANQIYDDSIVYTLDKQLKDKRYKYKWGIGNVDRKLWDMYAHGRFTYVTNMEGSIMDDFMNSMKRL